MLMGNSNATGSKNQNSFVGDFAIGTAVGALSAAAGIFAIKRCTSKHAGGDNFYRV